MSCAKVSCCLAAALIFLGGRVAAHGGLTFPRPRNALDASLAPWSNWSYPRDPIHFDYTGTDTAGSCPKSPHDGDADHLVSNGQACYWFSNGCTPGCPSCDGTSSHVGHGGQSFKYRGMTRDEVLRANVTVPWEPAPGDLVLDRAAAGTQALNITANCPRPSTQPTVCAPSLRTTNTQAECGGVDWGGRRGQGSSVGR